MYIDYDTTILPRRCATCHKKIKSGQEHLALSELRTYELWEDTLFRFCSEACAEEFLRQWQESRRRRQSTIGHLQDLVEEGLNI